MPHNPLKRLATPAGLEPATISLEGWCSIQLSYGAVFVADQWPSVNASRNPRA